MSAMLGKRKRVVKAAPAPPVKKIAIEREPQSDSEQDAMREAFRRAFEARFKPLDGVEEQKQKELEAQAAAELEEDESEDEDWHGISEEEEEEDAIEVIEHTTTAQRERADKALLKAFMSSKPPSDETTTPNPASKQTRKGTDDTVPEPEDDLKNDLALQRLLKESHLLDQNFSTTDPTGSNRHKATDLRLLDLGAKGSVFAQKNMPMSHRKGITKKATEREEGRRREAKENGVVLERERRKEVVGGGGDGKRRERGIGAPSVGRFSNGMLKLTDRDVEGITGPKGEGRGGKRGGGRGGGRGGRGGRGRGGKR